jgi:phosphotransferase system HPr-like phosphotransfer protein
VKLPTVTLIKNYVSAQSILEINVADTNPNATIQFTAKNTSATEISVACTTLVTTETCSNERDRGGRKDYIKPCIL